MARLGWQWIVGVVGLALVRQLSAEVTLTLDRPQLHQVHQRTGSAPGVGYAMVPIAASLPDGLATDAGAGLTWEYRTTPAESNEPSAWKPLRVELRERQLHADARVSAGWFRLELRARKGDESVASANVDPVGVGEVFVVAGQSYATNTNDERLRVQDPLNRVSAYDLAKGRWAVAHDPQPAPDGSDGGSIWPPLGDALVAQLKVPVAFANVAVGGTSSEQWMPGGTLHPRLAEVGVKVGRCRAVLWQQGESDVIAKTPAETYVANIRTIRTEALTAWGYSVPWLLAHSTHHPTVYNDPEGEGRIRGAIDTLTRLPGFRAGPDTDTLQGENRGDIASRRHFSAIGQRRAAALWQEAISAAFAFSRPSAPLRIGVAEVDITPPVGFPMAGYYHERLAEGEIDPLKAKAIVWSSGDTSAALVVCDLIGIATDLKVEVRKRAAERTGIRPEHIILSGTHTHTAPDYSKELYKRLGGEPQIELRAAYIEKLIAGPVEAIVAAQLAARPTLIESGATWQKHPVAFNRRSVMQDGTVRTWMSHDDPRVIRAAGPIDPEIGLVALRDLDGTPRGVLSNFALHLDTVGGSRWSADYPFFIERTLRSSLDPAVISVFGTGCCGDINHVNPRSKIRNSAEVTGGSLGETIQRGLAGLTEVETPTLSVKSAVVELPLQSADPEEITRALAILEKVNNKESVDFLEHVTAYKKLMLDGLRNTPPHAPTSEKITWGLSRTLKGVGDKLPVEVTVIAIGRDVAIVALPGEVFVELGLAIKQGSPFRTTLIVELSNAKETIYLPNRAAYAGGSYEVTNSATLPGSGEMLVETALRLLREAAPAE